MRREFRLKLPTTVIREVSRVSLPSFPSLPSPLSRVSRPNPLSRREQLLPLI